MASTPVTAVDQVWSLRSAMRRLWTDHVIWTRMYIVAAVADGPLADDGAASAARLLRNQDDIGRAVVPFYGKEAGAQLTDLLKQHILIAVDLVAAAKSGNQAKFQEEDDRWTRNAEQIADLLSGANPSWPKADVVDLLGQHLALTKDETVARLQQNWDADVEAFDQIFTEILTVADVLTSGLIKQFPQRFDVDGGKSEKATSLQLALGRLWSDHVLWTRQYILSAVADAPDTGAAAGRLLKNQEDIGAAVGSVYGEAAGKQTTELLKQHIMIAVDIVDAAKKHDDARFKQANESWHRNAEAIAGLLSSANPHWPEADVTDLLMQHLNLTRRELTSHMGGQHEDDVEAMDLILTEILTVANVLATGIVKQFPDRF
jgi:hypothetical protein